MQSNPRRPALKQSLKSFVRLAGAFLAAALLYLPYADSARSADHETKIALGKESIFFELNHTDGDLGIHILIDGKAWKTLKIEDPSKGTMLEIEVVGSLRMQGLTELFSESAEPPFDELPPDEFFARFPEGEYKITGKTIEDEQLEGSAELTHVMPAPPGNVLVSGVAAAKDCDEGPIPSVRVPVTISWDPVSGSHPTIGKTAPVEIVNYEVVVSREGPTSMEISVDIPPGTKQFEVPERLTDIDAGDEFKFEIVVKEASGNQTVFESCFNLKR